MDKKFIKLDELLVEVKIVDERNLFGYKQLLVIPTAGSRQKWVNEESILTSKQVGK